jgi:diguanylate cyclase (GGDEF)-like protein
MYLRLNISKVIQHAMATGVAVFTLACVGIASREVDSLAAFWPANAVLLGVFLRWPQFARWSNWAAAIVAFVAADLVTGGSLETAVWLTVANLTGIAAGATVYRRLMRDDPELRRSRSILGLFLVSTVAAIGAAIIGALAAPQTMDSEWFDGFGFWFANEFTNYMLILPLLLLLPMPATARLHMQLRLERDSVSDLAPPVLALLLSLAVSGVVGGPGAIAFPVPALIWCSLMFSPWVISILNFVMGIFFLVASASGWLVPGTTDVDSWEIISLRFGVALLALGPLTLSEIERDRRYAMDNLRELATQDSLTAVMNRRAFDHAAMEILDRARRGKKPVALLMMDVDHFKRVNDTYGHLAGDLVLTRLASIMSITLPTSSVVGRVGGEEFAAVVPALDQCQVYELADRIRSRVESESAEGSAYQTLGATVSIGVAWQLPRKETTLEHLMETADHALYEAKSMGRNHVVLTASNEANTQPAVASAPM